MDRSEAAAICRLSKALPTPEMFAAQQHGFVTCPACGARVRLSQRRLDRDASADNTILAEHRQGGPVVSHAACDYRIAELEAELRRLQRIVIDAELLVKCDDLCLVHCAGPCQGENGRSTDA